LRNVDFGLQIEKRRGSGSEKVARRENVWTRDNNCNRALKTREEATQRTSSARSFDCGESRRSTSGYLLVAASRHDEVTAFQ
jgi:hypothetical protein